MEFLDAIEVTGAPVTNVQFGAGGDGQFATELDGDVDGRYKIFCNIVHNTPAALRDFLLMPNSISANQQWRRMRWNSVDTFDGATDGMRFLELQDDFARMMVEFEAARSPNGVTALTRSIKSQGVVWSSVASVADFGWAAVGAWEDTTTKVTTLEIRCTTDATTTATADIGVGSVFELYRERPRQHLL